MTGRQPPSSGSTSHGAGALHSSPPDVRTTPPGAAAAFIQIQIRRHRPRRRPAAPRKPPVPDQKGTSPRPSIDGHRRRRLVGPPRPGLLAAAARQAGAQTEGDLGQVHVQAQAPLPAPRQACAAGHGELAAAEAGGGVAVGRRLGSRTYESLARSDTVEAPAALAVTGEEDIDLLGILPPIAAFSFFYFLVAPPLIMNWLRTRWYKRDFVETYLHFMFTYLFYPA
ncbi:uncharacterized protein LOC120660630 isoform X2 [Panicum virgatum]|nr:uncharacterized protein LOC120660630 isoform X2 [Panicum virgatum]